MWMLCFSECAPVFARELKLIVKDWSRRYCSIFLQVLRHFAAQILPWNAQFLVIDTSRTKYIEDSEVEDPGANLIDLFNEVNLYPPVNLRSEFIVTGFNDHYYSCSHFPECYRVLLDIKCYKFQTLFYASLKTNATSNDKIVYRKVCFMNLALHCFFVHSYIVPLIILSYFLFSKSAFCWDKIHFFFYGNYLFV